MFRRFSVNFALFSMLFDAVLVGGALFAANCLRPWLSRLPFTANLPHITPIPALLYVVFPLGWVVVLLLFSVYDGRKNLRVSDELAALSAGSTLAAISMAGVLYLSFRDLSRVLFLTFILITYLALITWRLGARLFFRIANGKATVQRKVLIIGAGPVGRQMEEQIAQKTFLGLEVIGFLDDDDNKRYLHNDILGSLNDLRRVIGEKQVDDVVIALPRRAYEKVNQLVAELHNLPVKVWVIPDYFHLALHKAVVEEFAGLPMLDLRAPALNDYQRMVKRAFDLFAGTLLQIVALPLMAVIAIAIKLDSPGPVIFKQLRVGENGRLFWMYKFRSMVQDADQRLGEVMRYDENGKIFFKDRDDPRVTRVGRLLRRTSLDELPNFFNVLKGEMSLVGPRPELPLIVEQYEPWQLKRLAVPQGITGWWQVNGRSDKPMHLHTEEDIYYVQHYSLLLDLQIIIKTVWVVLRGKGAY